MSPESFDAIARELPNDERSVVEVHAALVKAARDVVIAHRRTLVRPMTFAVLELANNARDVAMASLAAVLFEGGYLEAEERGRAGCVT